MFIRKSKLESVLEDMIRDSQQNRKLCIAENRHKLGEYWFGKEVAYKHILECYVRNA